MFKERKKNLRFEYSEYEHINTPFVLSYLPFYSFNNKFFCYSVEQRIKWNRQTKIYGFEWKLRMCNYKRNNNNGWRHLFSCIFFVSSLSFFFFFFFNSKYIFASMYILFMLNTLVYVLKDCYCIQICAFEHQMKKKQYVLWLNE